MSETMPESERTEIMRENRPQNIEVDWDMLLERGKDAERAPGRKPRMWALLTEIDDGNPPRLREVASGLACGGGGAVLTITIRENA